MQPLNYIVDVKDPFQAGFEGLAQGMAIAQQRDKQQVMQAQLMQQQQMQSDMAALANNPNPSAKDYARMMTMYPQLSEQYKKSWEVLNPEQQQSTLSDALKIDAAMRSGQYGIAQGLIDEKAKAYENSGNQKEAAHWRTFSKIISSDPTEGKGIARTMVSAPLVAILGPDKYASYAGEVRAQEKQPAEMEKLGLENRYKASQIREINSQITDRAERLSLDRDKLQSDVEMKLYELGQKGSQLDDGARKLINESTVASVSADQSAGQMLDLATRLEKQGGGYGAASTISEWLKSATGNQDALSQMRAEYTRLRNAQAIKMLPPGPATDKDIQIAMKGFPSESADAQTMASFLRGMAKLNQYNSATEGAKAEWVNSVGHLGKPKKDIEVDGIAVPAGSTFTDFAKQYIEGKSNKRATEQGQAQVPNRSYQRWAK